MSLVAIIVGGFKFGIFYVALTAAIGLYHASHIAEIVVGGVADHLRQTERVETHVASRPDWLQSGAHMWVPSCLS